MSAERVVKPISGWLALPMVWLMYVASPALFWWAFAGGESTADGGYAPIWWAFVAAIVILLLAITATVGFYTLQPNEARVLILFGGILVYAAAHIAIGMANGVRPTPEVRQGHDLLSILAGIALYGLMAQIHGAVIGVPVFSITP